MYFKPCLIIILFCILNEGIAADFNKRFFSEVKRYCFLFLFFLFFKFKFYAHSYCVNVILDFTQRLQSKKVVLRLKTLNIV